MAGEMLTDGNGPPLCNGWCGGGCSEIAIRCHPTQRSTERIWKTGVFTVHYSPGFSLFFQALSIIAVTSFQNGSLGFWILFILLGWVWTTAFKWIALFSDVLRISTCNSGKEWEILSQIASREENSRRLNLELKETRDQLSDVEQKLRQNERDVHRVEVRQPSGSGNMF